MAAHSTIELLAHIFGVLGNIVSFSVFLSPSPTFYKIYRARTTQGFNPLPYSVALFSCMLTGYYGLVKYNLLLITINAIGIVIESSYLAIYMVFASRREKVNATKLLLSFNVGLLGLIILLTSLITHGKRRESTVGSICAVCAVCVFASPFSVIRTVIRTKSVEFVPFWLSFSLTNCAIIWFFYGLLVADVFIAMPNVLGFIFGVVQMTLYFVYKNSKKPEEEEEVGKASEFSAVDLIKVEAGENENYAMEEDMKCNNKCSVENEIVKAETTPEMKCSNKCSVEHDIVNAETTLEMPPMVESAV